MEEHRDNITSRLLAHMKKEADDEDERIARDIAETDAQLERERKEKEEKNNAELKSITEHRMNVVRKIKLSMLFCFIISYLSVGMESSIGSAVCLHHWISLLPLPPCTP